VAPTPILTQRVTRGVLVPLVVALLILVIPLVVLDARDARSQALELVERRAATVALLVGGSEQPAEETLAQLAGLPGERLALVDRQGATTVGATLVEDILAGPTLSTALRGMIASEVVPRVGLVVAAAPLVVDGDVVGAAVVTVPDRTIAIQTRTTRITIGVASLVLLGAALWAARSLARAIVRPIEELDAVASRLAAGDMSARAKLASAPPELERLAATLNRSADELQHLLSLQRSFVADASHQLRTPLAGLRLRLENEQLARGDPDGRLEAAIAEADRLSALVDELLSLASAERGDLQPVTIDVASIARARVAAWSVVAAGAGVTITCLSPEAAPAHAVPGGLEQVLDNLLANAVTASPDGSPIEVEVRRARRAVHCVVRDRGPGMTAQEREAAFERFWRSPRSTSKGGSGLGLPIAASLVHASGGAIELRPRPGGGLIAEVRLVPSDAASAWDVCGAQDGEASPPGGDKAGLVGETR
jgi:signal transduction histidine kinase